MPSEPAFKSFRRVVTTHAAAGKSIVQSIDTLTPTTIDSGDAGFQLVWITATVPANLNDGSDGPSAAAGKTLKSGSVIRIVDMVPGRRSWWGRASDEGNPPVSGALRHARALLIRRASNYRA